MADDERWLLGQQTKLFQSHLGELRGWWQDQAAHGIHERFLTPHREESAALQRAIEAQHGHLEQAVAYLRLASKHERESLTHASDMRSLVQSAVQELATAASEYRQFTQHEAEVQRRLPVIQTLIHQANQAGA